MSLIRNERTKLTATWLNSISAALIPVGGFAQLAPLFSGTATATRPDVIALFSAVWIVLGVAVHVTAWLLLGRLQG